MEPYQLGALVMGVALGAILLLALIIGLYINGRLERREAKKAGEQKPNMEVTTEQLKEVYPTIIDRLDEIFSHGLYHPLTLAEQSEADELRRRAWMIHTELSKREHFSASLFA